MKTLFFIVAAAILTLNSVEDLPNHSVNNYCAELKDGILSITNDGNKLGSDITLANGTLIKLNGEIIKKDGSKFILKVGECVDNEGNLISGPEKKTKQEPY